MKSAIEQLLNDSEVKNYSVLITNTSFSKVANLNFHNMQVNPHTAYDEHQEIWRYLKAIDAKLVRHECIFSSTTIAT